MATKGVKKEEDTAKKVTAAKAEAEAVKPAKQAKTEKPKAAKAKAENKAEPKAEAAKAPAKAKTETAEKPAAKADEKPKAEKKATAKKPAAKKTEPAKKPAAKKAPAEKPAAKKKAAESAVPAEPAMKVLFAASEAQPFIASGGLADVAGALPKALAESGVDCRVVMPLYGDMKPEMREKLEYITCFDVTLGWRRQYCGVFKATVGKVTYYFIDNEYYFKRTGIYGFFDDAERFAYFSKAIIEMLPHIGFFPDYIHANDWQTALVPVYLNLQFRYIEGYGSIKTIFTIHNIQYQGKYGLELMEDVLGIDKKETHILEFEKCVNFMKAAVEMSDRVTTVSPSYADEILNPWFSHGLDAFLVHRRFKLSGILNGIDVESYNPETDKMIFKNYSSKTLKDKAVNKAELLKQLSMEPIEGAPVIGIVSRLVAHKGMDLVKYVFEDMLKLGTQVVVLGSGEYGYEEFFRFMQDKHPDRVRFVAGFVPDLARKIYAGADIFLMPSKSEPCGLAQMIAARYGTIPVVRETGGLRDSIKDYGGGDGNGYTFKTYNAHDMLGAMERTCNCYHNEEAWTKLQQLAMASDFTWSKSAEKYIELYKSI